MGCGGTPHRRMLAGEKQDRGAGLSDEIRNPLSFFFRLLFHQPIQDRDLARREYFHTEEPPLLVVVRVSHALLESDHLGRTSLTEAEVDGQDGASRLLG